LHGLADKIMPPEVQVAMLLFSRTKSLSIYTAARLQIADYLADAEKSIDELAKATSTDPDALYRLMRALASEGIFHELPGKRFKTTPQGRALEKDAEISIWPSAMLTGHEIWRDPWYALTHSIQTGEAAFEHVFGERYFDYLESHPEAGSLFNLWMTRAAETNRGVLDAIFNSERPGKVIDIGGGQGFLIRAALESNPQLSGVLFDLPEVVANVTLSEEIASRCEVVGGDFFTSVPERGDIYVLQQIIHDWGDEDCIKILRKCAEAMNEGGRIFILEAVLADMNKPDFNKFSDLQMLVLTHGGRERTEAEFHTLLSGAGLTINRVVPTPSPFHLIEASK